MGRWEEGCLGIWHDFEMLFVFLLVSGAHEAVGGGRVRGV